MERKGIEHDLTTLAGKLRMYLHAALSLDGHETAENVAKLQKVIPALRAALRVITDPAEAAECSELLRDLERHIEQLERRAKHGRH